MALASTIGACLFLAGGSAAIWIRRNRCAWLPKVGLGLVAASLVVRVVLVFAIGPDGLSGSDPYPAYAARLAAGSGYVDSAGEPTAYFPPGWPLVLSGAYVLFGVSDWAMLMTTTLMGVGIVLAVWQTTSLLLGPRWGVIAANVAGWSPSGALKPFSFESDLAFEFCAALVLLCAALLVRAVRAEAHGEALGWGLAMGLCSGAMLLTRPYGLMYAALVCLIVVLGMRNRRAVAPVLVALLLAALALAGWTARNIISLSAPIVVSSNGGVNLYIGTQSLQFSAPKLDAAAELSEHESDLMYRRAALEAIGEAPGRFLINGGKKAVLVYANDTGPISGLMQSGLSHVQTSRPVQVGLVAVVNGYYWSLLALAAAGWICLIYQRLWFRAAMLGLAPVMVASIAFVFFAQGRFHWFAMPSVMILSVVWIRYLYQMRPPVSARPTPPARFDSGPANSLTSAMAMPKLAMWNKSLSQLPWPSRYE